MKIMKKLFLLLLFAVALCSCETYLDKWDPIELDKQELTFSSKGGVQTISALNYPTWWINGAYEGDIFSTDNFVYATSSDTLTYFKDILDGEWYHAEIPKEKSANNRLVITVYENTTSTPRQASINMQAGNAFAYINIHQQ